MSYFFLSIVAIFFGCFITATDTDAGKTVFTAGLLRAMLARNLKACAIKPVQTGCFSIDDNFAENVHVCAANDETLFAPDVIVYAEAVKVYTEQAPVHVLHTFKPACSPRLAVQKSGEKELDISEIASKCFSVADKKILPLLRELGEEPR